MLRTHLASVRNLALGLLVCTTFAIAGCGNSSGTQYSGSVTFQGQPIPSGKIYFQPDSTQGNSGQTGYANIKDGKYDTSSDGGMGAPSGPMIVAVEGFAPAAAAGTGEGGDEVSNVRMFPRFEKAVDLTSANGKFDIDVPVVAPTATGQPGVMVNP